MPIRTQVTGAQVRKAQVLCSYALMLLCSCALVSLCPCALAEEITVFFTGNELGQLQPCGCSGGQLGGLDKRYAVFNAVAPEKRLIFDTGSLVPESTEQNLIKLNIITQAFNMLGYDAVNLTEQDILIARRAGLFEGLGQLFNCITSDMIEDVKLPASFTRRFSINGPAVDVTVGTASTDEQLSELDKLFSRPADSSTQAIPVNILIISRSDASTIASISQTGLVDCLIVPELSDEPTLISDANSRPLIISAGRLGKYVGKIKVGIPGRQGKPLLSFSAIAITEKIQSYQPLVELYKDYQRMVRDANLLENYPRFVLPDNLEYVGSKSCKLCHDYEYEKWMNSGIVNVPGRTIDPNSRHSNALASLVNVGSDYDPECVICHVVGMQYQTGFITAAKTPGLKDVGCENCHGPGSEHIRSLGASQTAGPMSACTDCHTPDQSGEYAAHKDEYLQKTVHWREPASRIKAAEPRKDRKQRSQDR